MIMMMMYMLQKMHKMRRMNPEIYEDTEKPSDKEEINQLASGEKQFQETNKTDDSNDDTDAESEEEGKSLVNEDKRDRQWKRKQMIKLNKGNKMISIKRKAMTEKTPIV